MRNRILTSISFAAAIAMVVSAAPVLVAGQSQVAKKASATKPWTPPRTADGQPDLMGIWANNSATPFERPKEVGDRQLLTDAEVAALQKSANELFNGDTDAAFGDAVFKSALAKSQGKDADIKALNGFDTVTGNYNQFWLVDRSFDNRTSVVTTPDGKIPPTTEEAKKRQQLAADYRKAHPADVPEDLPLGHRCVNFGVPKIGAGYKSYYQVFQGPGYVAILREMAHDARIIPYADRVYQLEDGMLRETDEDSSATDLGQHKPNLNGDAAHRYPGGVH